MSLAIEYMCCWPEGTPMQHCTVVGIDPHSQTHVAAAVDQHGRVIAQLSVGTDAQSLRHLIAWASQLPAPRLVAVEGAKGYGRILTRMLLAAGEEVVDVATYLTGQTRRNARHRGKDDEGDAVVIARVAVRESDLPCMDSSHLDADLKLLVDA